MWSRSAWCVLALAAVLCSFPSFALDPSLALTQYVQTGWRMEDGLPHNSVRAVIQSRDGYLWLGTYGGLVRFDGARFVVFDNRNSRLLHNTITSLAEDRDGTIWIGTMIGGLHRLRDGTIEPFRGIAHRSINGLTAGHDGTVWVATNGGAYAVKHGVATRYGEAAGLPTFVNATTAAAGAIWVATGRGLFRLHGGRAVPYAVSEIGDGEVMSVFRDRKGRIWAGTRDRVFEFEWDASSSALRAIRTLTLPGVWGWVARFLEDADGNLWIGSYGGGLFRWSGGRMDSISTAQGFLDHRPWALLEDAEGSLWVGTRGGLARLRDGAAVSISTEEGLPAPIVRSVLEDREGTLWIGTESGLSEFRDGKLAQFADPRVSIGAARTLAHDLEGNVWVGGDFGIAQIDRTARRFSRVLPTPAGIGRIRSLLCDRAGRKWVGGDRGVAVSAPGTARGLWQMPPGLEDLSQLSIESLYEDRAGAIWIATLTDGLRRWHEGRVENLPLLEDTAVGVRSFHEDPDGRMIVGSLASGLFIRAPGEDFVRITTKEGLPDDGIWSILPIGEIYWMSSDRGIFGVRKQALLDVARGRSPRLVVERTVGIQDGMKSAECNGSGAPGFVGRDGRIWVSTSRGAVGLDPRKLARNRRPPPVIIEETLIDGRAVARAGTLDIPAGSRDIEIHFTGLSFVDPSRVTFRYRLEGHDESWHDTGARRAAYFSRLPPGNYVLRVHAANNDGVWNTEGAALPVRVRPRLTQTWPFRVAAGLAIAAMAWGWLHARTRRHREREEELQRIVAERTEELERANEQLAELAAIDDLTGIANHRRLLSTLDAEWRRCQRDGEALSLLLCDIDDFKTYNDSYGHLEGDDCLRRVAAALTASLPGRTDLAARYGGEEFAIILPSTDAARAHDVAQRVLEAVRDLAIEHRASRAGKIVTVSIGCATVRPRPAIDANDLIGAADAALYTAKASGRNRVVSAVDEPAAVAAADEA